MNTKYINEYNKNSYKQYIFRVKKNDKRTISKLDGIKNKNKYIYDLINNDFLNSKDILTLKQIKQIIIPILNKYGIYEIYLFGSYARGEANKDSDLDIYCEQGNINSFITQGIMEDELEASLNKKVDVIFTSSTINAYFKKTMMEDLIKLC